MGLLLAIPVSLSQETRSYRGVEIALLSAKAGEKEYRVGTFVTKADPGKELVILELRFDTTKVPKQQAVSLGHLRVLGPAGEVYGDSKLGTVEGGAPAPLVGTDIVIPVPAGSRPKTVVIKGDKGEALTFELDKLLKVPR